MPDEPKNVTEITRHSTRREWRRPGLRRLPIAATASSKSFKGDEGQGQGKGDAASIS